MSLYNNITKVLALVVAIFTLSSSYASESRREAEQLWQQSLDAYTAKDYTAAQQALERIVELDEATADVYYNLGNVYYKLGQQGDAAFSSGELGRAILNYRRALRLNPSMEDARYNLDLAVDHTNDAEPLPLGVVGSMWASVRGLMSSNGWAALSVTLFVLTLALVLVYLLSNHIVLRKVAFFVAATTLTLSLFGTVFSLSQKALYEDGDEAVVVCKSITSVHASPDNTSKIIRQPSQGVTVRVLRSHDKWSEIEFADGEKAWILTTEIERV